MRSLTLSGGSELNQIGRVTPCFVSYQIGQLTAISDC